MRWVGAAGSGPPARQDSAARDANAQATLRGEGAELAVMSSMAAPIETGPRPVGQDWTPGRIAAQATRVAVAEESQESRVHGDRGRSHRPTSAWSTGPRVSRRAQHRHAYTRKPPWWCRRKCPLRMVNRVQRVGAEGGGQQRHDQSGQHEDRSAARSAGDAPRAAEAGGADGSRRGRCCLARRLPSVRFFPSPYGRNYVVMSVTHLIEEVDLNTPRPLHCSPVPHK